MWDSGDSDAAVIVSLLGASTQQKELELDLSRRPSDENMYSAHMPFLSKIRRVRLDLQYCRVCTD